MAARKILENEVGNTDIAKQSAAEQYFDDIFDSEEFVSDEFEIEEVGIDSVAANEDLWEILDITEEEWDAASEGGYLMP